MSQQTANFVVSSVQYLLWADSAYASGNIELGLKFDCEAWYLIDQGGNFGSLVDTIYYERIAA
jgi:hypothetical protein